MFGTANTTFQRAWGQDGNDHDHQLRAVGNQISTAGWGTFGYGGETTCRAREYGTTLIAGGTAPTIAQRQAAGAYWLNTSDPDYTNPAMSPTDPLLVVPNGTNNRVAVTINPNDYTVSAVFGNSYFTSLAGWTRATIPIIMQSPANQMISVGGAATFSVTASGLPSLSYQWQKSGTNIVGATNATLAIASTKLADNGSYSVTVSNSAGQVASGNAVLTVQAVPAPITSTFINGALNLSWPADLIGYHLEVQTNNPAAGLTTNWVSLGYATTNSVSFPINFKQRQCILSFGLPLKLCLLL